MKCQCGCNNDVVKNRKFIHGHNRRGIINGPISDHVREKIRHTTKANRVLKDRIGIKNPNWKEGRDKDPAWHKIWQHRWKNKSYERYLLNQARDNSKEKKVAFNLTIEDIIIPNVCPLLGIKLTFINGQGIVLSNPSVDRIDPTKGYIKRLYKRKYTNNFFKSKYDEVKCVTRRTYYFRL